MRECGVLILCPEEENRATTNRIWNSDRTAVAKTRAVLGANLLLESEPERSLDHGHTGVLLNQKEVLAKEGLKFMEIPNKQIANCL